MTRLGAVPGDVAVSAFALAMLVGCAAAPHSSSPREETPREGQQSTRGAFWSPRPADVIGSRDTGLRGQRFVVHLLGGEKSANLRLVIDYDAAVELAGDILDRLEVEIESRGGEVLTGELALDELPPVHGCAHWEHGRLYYRFGKDRLLRDELAAVLVSIDGVETRHPIPE